MSDETRNIVPEPVEHRHRYRTCAEERSPEVTKNPSWTGADALESALDTAEEVGIGPGTPSGILVPDANGRGWRPITKAEKRALSNSPEPATPRFGERLRVALAGGNLGLATHAVGADLRDLADQVDADRDAYRHHLLALCSEQESERLADLRARVKAAVEQLRFSASVGLLDDDQDRVRDIVDADDLLAVLSVIFGPAGTEEKARDFDAVLSAYLEWSLRTFPTSTPSSVAAHLRKEVAELQAHPESAEELADIVALAFHSAARQGHDLMAALDAKLSILKTRTWQEPDADGAQEHVREPSLAPDVEAALVNGARMQSQNLRPLLRRCELALGTVLDYHGRDDNPILASLLDDLREALEPEGGGSVLGGEHGRERREAAADRYTDRDGRVDGVDR